MGILGLFKKNTIAGSVTPKCSYCKNGRPAKTDGMILCQRCGIVSSDFSCKKFIFVPEKNVPENKPQAAVPTVNQVPEPAAPVSAPAPAIKKQEEVLPVKETAPEIQSPVKEIDFKPHDNSENIRRLETIQPSALAEIRNEVKPKEINLPDTSDCFVSDIFGIPENRNSEEYLKTVEERTVSDFESKPASVHNLPPDTRIPSISDL